MGIVLPNVSFAASSITAVNRFVIQFAASGVAAIISIEVSSQRTWVLVNHIRYGRLPSASLSLSLNCFSVCDCLGRGMKRRT